MLVGENVGAGDDQYFEDEARWREAADKGRAGEFIKTLPQGYHTQLGKWFRDGRELSGGQWQKIALARAFMRTQADVLVLDEPTAAMDAQAEAEVFEHFRQLATGRITILISHRFSTVRMADRIAVLDHGRMVERGSHEQLMALNGRYAHLFTLQAKATGSDGPRVLGSATWERLLRSALLTRLQRGHSSCSPPRAARSSCLMRR